MSLLRNAELSTVAKKAVTGMVKLLNLLNTQSAANDKGKIWALIVLQGTFYSILKIDEGLIDFL
jgi:hypothetical protein